MIDSSGNIHIDTWVQISQHKSLNRQVCLLDLAVTLPLRITFFKGVKEVFGESCVLLVVLIGRQASDLIIPGDSDLIFKFVILSARQESKHFFAMGFNAK